MRYLIAAVVACFLTACAPEIVYRPVPVNVPVSVPCQAPATPQPVLATAGITADDTMLNQVKALAVTNEQRKAFEARLMAANKACQ
jgi:hypothetical protein